MLQPMSGSIFLEKLFYSFKLVSINTSHVPSVSSDPFAVEERLKVIPPEIVQTKERKKRS